MTIGRLVSVCGAIGVSTIASTFGCTIGPPAARLYAVDPVGVAMISPSARTRVTRPSPTRHGQVDQTRTRALVDDDVVQRDFAGRRRRGPQRRRAKHQALFDVSMARERRLERGIELGERHLGEKAEAAEIDAENRNRQACAADAIGHAEQRAVAAEHEHQADARRRATACRPRGGEDAAGISAAVAVSKTASTPRSREPRLDVHQMRRRRLQPRLRDDAHAGR